MYNKLQYMNILESCFFHENLIPTPPVTVQTILDYLSKFYVNSKNHSKVTF